MNKHTCILVDALVPRLFKASLIMPMVYEKLANSSFTIKYVSRRCQSTFKKTKKKTYNQFSNTRTQNNKSKE